MADADEKQKRLAEYLGDEPTLSIAGRAEQAFKEQQKKEEERLSALKLSHGTGADRRGSLRGKWEGAMEANKGSDHEHTADISSPASSIAGRTEQAFKEQQKKEEERLSALKLSHGTGADRGPASERRGSLKGKWEGVLQTTRKAEQDKVDTKKDETKSQFKTTEGSGLVSQRIGQWEELIMMNVASSERVDATAAAALALINARWESEAAKDATKCVDAGDVFSSGAANAAGEEQTSSAQSALFTGADISIIPEHVKTEHPDVELFYSGDTKLYDAKNSSGYSRLLPFSKEYSTKPLPLPCGMSSSQGEAEGANASSSTDDEKPGDIGVDVIALVMNAGVGNTFFAITIIGRNSQAAENDAFARECGLGISYVYGLKKISVFDPSGAHVVKDIFVYLVEKVVDGKTVDGKTVHVAVVDPVCGETDTNAAEMSSDGMDSESVPVPARETEEDKNSTENEIEPEDGLDGDSTEASAFPDASTGIPGPVGAAVVCNNSADEVVLDVLVKATSNEDLSVQGVSASSVPETSQSSECQSSPRTPSKPDEGDSTWKTQYTPPSRRDRDRDEEEGGNEEGEEDSGDDDDSEFGTGGELLKSGFFSFGRSKSTAHAISQSKYIQPAAAADRASYVPNSPSLMSKASSSGKGSLGGCGHWTLEDEGLADTLPFGSETIISMAIEDILSISCTSSALVMHCDNKHRKYSNTAKPATRRLSWTGRKSAEEANAIGAGVVSDSVSVMVTGTLKHTIISTPSLYVLSEDKLFEYLRGAAMSG